jgi:hypothetical protein
MKHLTENVHVESSAELYSKSHVTKSLNHNIYHELKSCSVPPFALSRKHNIASPEEHTTT